MSLFVSAPGVPTSGVGPAVRAGLRMTWTGWDGSVWDLTSPTSGVQLKAGVRGLSMPPQLRHRRESPAVAGSVWKGWRALEREVFWPLGVYADGSREWLEFDAAFWATMHPERTGVWTVTQTEAGVSRHLTCRFDNDSDHAFTIDPSLVGWEFYGVYLAAEDPFWRGDPIVRHFMSQSGGAFLPNPGDPFVVRLSPGSTLAAASVRNPGDVDAWPVWTVHGPITSAQVGVAGRVVEVPVALDAGEWLRIDTAPTAQTAVDNAGAERTAELGEVDFAPVPPGGTVDLSLSLVGSGSVEVSIEPRYLRAW